MSYRNSVRLIPIIEPPEWGERLYGIGRHCIISHGSDREGPRGQLPMIIYALEARARVRHRARQSGSVRRVLIAHENEKTTP